MSIITGNNISKFRMEVMLSGLKLELGGMKRRGRSMCAIIKGEFGLKGNRQKVYDQFKQIVQDVRDGVIEDKYDSFDPTIERCNDCEGKGYIFSNDEEGNDEVQRCDTCKKFNSDEEAKRVKEESE